MQDFKAELRVEVNEEHGLQYSRDNIEEYPEDALARAMKVELKSMRDFDVCEEVSITDVEPDCARQAIGTR